MPPNEKYLNKMKSADEQKVIFKLDEEDFIVVSSTSESEPESDQPQEPEKQPQIEIDQSEIYSCEYIVKMKCKFFSKKNFFFQILLIFIYS